MIARTWTEYWVSEIDINGDVIDYTAQTFASEDRGGKDAQKVFDGRWVFDDAVRKELERVDSEGEDSVGERVYSRMAERTR